MKKLLILLLALCIMAVPTVYGDDTSVEDEEITEEAVEEDVIEEEFFEEEASTDIETVSPDEIEWTEDMGVEDEISTEVMSVPDGITIVLNDKIVKFDAAQPALINNRTMVPMRKIFEALKAEVTWDNNTQTAKATKDDMTVEITIGSNVMYSNGNPVTIDSPALLLRNRTYVPVRFISNALGATVDWDNDKQIVYITTK